MKSLIAILAAVFMTSCYGKAEPSEPVSLDVTLMNPEPGLEVFAKTAADDLNKHLGIGISFSSSGSRIHSGTADKGACAETTVFFFKRTHTVARIDMLVTLPVPAGCPQDLSVTIEHEMIHVLRAELTIDMPEEQDDHSEHGLFQFDVGPEGEVLEETSAAKACETGLCSFVDLDGQGTRAHAGDWCCYDDGASSLTCDLESADADVWTDGPCWDAALPEPGEEPAHPGSAR